MAPSRTSQSGSLWPVDSVRDVAESVGIHSLPDEVAVALAGDVEYRLHEIIEESVKFMHHARRTVLKAEDVDYALKCRNVDPLWGFSLPSTASDGPSYLKTPTANGTIYVQEDEEIDLTKLLSLPMPHLPRQVTYTAHWLAVEGVQPAIPSNPSPQDIEAYTALLNAAKRSTAAQTASKDGTDVDVRPLVKHVLSRELQLYFDRLTSALLPADTVAEGDDVENMRVAALASLRNDQGLAGLLPYLIQWAAERVASIAASQVSSLEEANTLGEVALGLVQSLLENRNLFVEPYLHQLIPIILTCLINAASPLGVRQFAAALLSNLITRYASTYPSLKPRVVKTILRALVEPGKTLATRYGALLGLRGLGPAAIESVLGVKKNLRGLGATLSEAVDVELAQECANLTVDALLVPFPPEQAELEVDVDEYGTVLGDALQRQPHILQHLVEASSSIPSKRPSTAMDQD